VAILKKEEALSGIDFEVMSSANNEVILLYILIFYCKVG
jgi:hypothetical protein